jgi:bisphosphoglycerate-dependent phosphoglycerate mutase family 1
MARQKITNLVRKKGPDHCYNMMYVRLRQLILCHHAIVNSLGLFTGWDDVPLAVEGVEEAKQAGKLLKLHGFEFDVVYTSWLGRAIETAWYVMDEMDCLWLPIIKSWRK